MQAIPRITSDFHSLTDVGWYGSAYLLANCALQPLAGKLYTHFGSKVRSYLADLINSLVLTELAHFPDLFRYL